MGTPALISPAQVGSDRRELAGWQSDPAALLDWLRTQITAAMIESIAGADYGHGREDNAACLRRICETGRVQHPIDSALREALQLSRWSEGESVDHMERAFACTLLSIEHIDDEQGCPIDDGTDTFVIQIESAIHLGRPAMERLEKLFVAIVEGHPLDPGGGHDFMAAQLALLLTAAWLDPEDARLPGLVDTMFNNYRRGWEREPEPGWLFELFRGGVRCPLFRSLMDEILGEGEAFATVMDAARPIAKGAS